MLKPSEKSPTREIRTSNFFFPLHNSLQIFARFLLATVILTRHTFLVNSELRLQKPKTQDMDETQSDLIAWYKLETEFFQDHIRHARYIAKARGRNEEVKEDWSNCWELGRGGFGVVYKQIQETTGRYRAVKTIDKRRHSKIHYSRELLVMAILAKVCVLAPEGIHSTGSLSPVRDTLTIF